jgi:L-threonylcarbamoyladenylate synthase
MDVSDAAVAAIRAGELAVLPTDTVYGLCALPYHEEPVRRLYRVKGRADSVPTALVCPSVEMLLECLPELRGRSGVIARALLPGPYTLVFPNPSRRYRWLTGERPEAIGVRVPAVEGATADILGRVGAVVATSANLPGQVDPRRLQDVPEEIRAASAALVDGGELPGVPSTVLDLTGPEPTVVREGAGRVDEALDRLASASAVA